MKWYLFYLFRSYAITLVVDGFVLNAIDFWTDRPGLSFKEGDSQKLTSRDGKSEFLIKKTAEGFNMKQIAGKHAGKEVDFVLDHSTNTWYLVHMNKKTRLAQLIETDAGEMVKVPGPGGHPVLVDANMRDRDKILDEIAKSHPVTAPGE